MRIRKRFLILWGVILIASTVYAAQVVRIAPLTYSIKSTKVSVGGTATALPATALVGRESLIIYNDSASTITVYIGASDVDTVNGFPLNSVNRSFNGDLDNSVIVYGITSGATASVYTIEAK